MLFKDRSDAGIQLVQRIAKDQVIMKDKKRLVVASILRGGVLVGYEIAKKLSLPHLFLSIAKIRHPHNEELAIGAVCNGEYFLDAYHINRLELTEKIIYKQIKNAIKKQKKYTKKFVKSEVDLDSIEVDIKNKTVIIVDDGIATGASVNAALQYMKKKEAKKIMLAVPVSPADFEASGFDHAVILHKTDSFHAVSQFFQEFNQVKDQDILKMEGSV